MGDETEYLVEVEYTDDHLPDRDSILWHLEPAADVVSPDGYPRILSTGPMRAREFEAVRRAVRWNALTAYVSEVGPDTPLVAPFLGGVQVEDYQLVPLAKALSMPRVTLGLFDDVGLGKTIEAGLAIGELIRRRRIRRILVLCPAWLRRQWQEELQSKFGMDFHLIDRDETGRARREFGMEANPWVMFPRAIASYHYLKQEDVLGEFMLAGRSAGRSEASLPWDLLIVDEVHNCMPAANGRDSDLAQMLGRIGKLFEHKIFLSATPHNGFTQCFTGLLSQLDPVRFTRKDSITEAERRRVGDIVVRRLKRDINELDEASGRKPRFVERILQPAFELDFGEGERALGRAFENFRVEFKRAIGSSTDAATRTAGNFVIEVLSKRLLSCPYAFADSWSRFSLGLKDDPEASTEVLRSAAETSRRDSDRDDEIEASLGTATRIAGAWTQRQRDKLRGPIRELEAALERLGLIPNEGGTMPPPLEDARIDHLIELIRDHVHADGRWDSGERLIVFTEYRTTLDYLMERLRTEFPAEAGERFLQLYGGMPENQRDEVKEAFNDPASPVRVLAATDAASEGANLQETARLLLHFDLPWNPSRIDQRNGRLDRHGQSRDVLIYHFTSESDSDLRFLDKLFHKIDSIREDLGSIGKLFDEAISRRFLMPESGPAALPFEEKQVLEELDRKAEKARRRQRAELEPTREDGAGLREALESFRAAIDLSADALRETLEVSLATGGEPVRLEGPLEDNRYQLSTVPAEFRHTIDATLRRRGTETGALLAVQFAPEDQLVDVGGRSVFRPRKDSTLLHLGHPLVRQALQALAVSRFPGSKRHGAISRWTVSMGEVPPGAEALVVVTVEEMATNRLRETIHHWVADLRFPVRGGTIQDRLPGVPPSVDRQGRSEALELASQAQDLWLDAEPEIVERVRGYASDVERRIRAKLQTERKAAASEQEKLLKERRDTLERMLSRTLDSKRRELEELAKVASEISLFVEDQAQARIEKAAVEEEMELERTRCREAIQYLQDECRRTLDEVIPRRYELPEQVLVYPVAVEIRFPGGGA